MKLNNERYSLEIVEKGGEILSFTDNKTGIQYMWQGDAKYWGGKNPALFPMISNVYGKKYEIDGKTYEMKNHGLARYATFKCVEQSENKIVMEFKSDDNTLSQYPFEFTFHTIYELVDNKLTITYEITNDGDKDMPFQFGLHPGFNCPLTENETFEEYKIEFPVEETLIQLVMDENKEKEPELVEVKTKGFNLSYDEINKYKTLLYKNIKSPYVELKGKEHGVRVSTVGYKYLAFWSPEGVNAPFVCIEPWNGHGDFCATGKSFYDREDTMILSSKKSYITSYTIEIF